MVVYEKNRQVMGWSEAYTNTIYNACSFKVRRVVRKVDAFWKGGEGSWDFFNLLLYQYIETVICISELLVLVLQRKVELRY